MSRFFVEEEAITGAHVYLEKPEDIKHLTKVLRGRVGDCVSVSDGTEWEYETEIEDIQETCVTLRIVDKRKFAREPETRVTLYQGIPKASKMETIIQKTVELGIDSIVPVFMERTVVVDKGQFGKKLSRWQKISDEAVKQCKRGVIPKVREPLKFPDMIHELETAYDLVICPYENEENRTIKDCLRGMASSGIKNGARVAVIIGPEGGFSENEIQMLSKIVIGREQMMADTDAPFENKVQIVTLGKTILRTETAGMAALAMIMYELEL